MTRFNKFLNIGNGLTNKEMALEATKKIMDKKWGFPEIMWEHTGKHKYYFLLEDVLKYTIGGGNFDDVLTDIEEGFFSSLEYHLKLSLTKIEYLGLLVYILDMTKAYILERQLYSIGFEYGLEGID